MVLSGHDEKKYPRFAKYLEKELPKVRHNKKVMRALTHWGILKKEKLILALDYQSGPAISLSDLGDLSHRVGSSHVCGRHSEQFPDVVKVNRKLIGSFELTLRVTQYYAGLSKDTLKHNGLPTDKSQLITRETELKQLVEQTLLHELVHYANVKAGKFHFDKDGNEIEAGFAFEEEAYGEVAACLVKPLTRHELLLLEMIAKEAHQSQ